MPFTFETTPLPGVIKVTPRVFQDNRGFFFEDYKRSEFYAAGIEADFVQEYIIYDRIAMATPAATITPPAARLSRLTAR